MEDKQAINPKYCPPNSPKFVALKRLAWFYLLPSHLSL